MFARAGVLLMLAATLGIAQQAKPPCVRALVALEDDVDSARARANDPFRFVTVDDARLADGTRVPAGSLGGGVVAIAHHAERGGRGGYLVIETRYVALASGAHVPASIDWTSAARATATGASNNIPGIVGAVPLAGYVLGPYAYIHHGKDVIIPRGAQVPVLLGDDVAAGSCRVEPPPAPSPSASPEPAIAPSPSPGAPQPNATSSPAPSPAATSR